MRQTVIGIFNDAHEARQALDRLRSSGFAEQDIDLSIRQADDYSDEPRYSGEYTTESTNSLNEDRLAERRRDDDGFGDKIERFFKNLFDSDDDVRKYSSVAGRNSLLTVCVDSPEQAIRAADILDECGAVDVDEQADTYAVTDNSTGTPFGVDSTYNTQDQGLTMQERSLEDGVIDNQLDNSRSITNHHDRVEENRFANDRDIDDVNQRPDQSINIIEEDLQIGKREVETGRVRVRSRIVERPVEESLRLREERVYVERTPVNRPATERDLDTFKEGEIELAEMSEVPVVNKEARVVEEVNLRKEVSEHEEVIRDTVRKTDVDVDQTETKAKRTRKGKTDLDL